MSATSPIDRVTVEALSAGRHGETLVFDSWTSLQIRSSLTEPSEASFELGDESGYERLAQLSALGTQFRVLINDRPRLTGRVEMYEATSDAAQSTTQRIVVRTRMTDAVYSGAPVGLNLKRASIKEFVLACYEGIGLKEKDFYFTGATSRDLMTGKATSGGRAPVALEPLTEEQAKVQPPESVFEAVDRHLRRHGLLHWDGADGRIIVAAPDDQQDPIYNLWLYRDRASGQFNNVLQLQRVQDVSDSPTVLGMFGFGGKADFTRSKIGAVRRNEDLIRAGFQRNVLVLDEAVRTKAIAQKRANREFAQRNRGLDRLTAVTDGLSYAEGNVSVPWAPDTTADIVATHLGGAIGQYYVEGVELTRSIEGDRSQLTLVKQGVWVL